MSALRDYVAAEAAMRLLRFRLQRTIPIAAPGAGLEWSATVPGGVYWEVLSASFAFTTSAVVANRSVALRARDADNNTQWRAESSFVHAASLNTVYSFVSGLGASVVGAGISMPLATPPVPLIAGSRIVSQTQLIDVGDAYSAIALTVIEWSAAQVGQHLEKVLGDAVFSTYSEREV